MRRGTGRLKEAKEINLAEIISHVMTRLHIATRQARLLAPLAKCASLASLLLLATGCPPRPRLPDCIVGNTSPSPKLVKKRASVPPAQTIDVSIDGSGSMQGLIGSPRASAAWKSLLRGLSLAAAATGQPIQATRSGSGKIQPLANINQASERCFFSGCSGYQSVSSSLDAVWKAAIPAGPGVPLKVAISDLEVNAGDISGLVAAIKPHVARGAVIGVLAVKLPFQGSVFNSQSEVVHTGQSQRPIYLLATGPQEQLKAFLNDVRTKTALGGVPLDAMRLSFLDEHVDRPTLKAVSVQGVPPQAIESGLAGQIDYQVVNLLNNAKGVRLSNSPMVGSFPTQLSQVAVAQIENVAPLGMPPATSSSVRMEGLQLQGQELVMELAIPSQNQNTALRATVPRGQLPEDWWISWNRVSSSSPASKEQTDGLLLLLTSLGTLLVEPGSTPAAAFCLSFSHR